MLGKIRIKLFWSHSGDDGFPDKLADQVNRWIEDNEREIEVLDIADRLSRGEYASVMVVYRHRI